MATIDIDRDAAHDAAQRELAKPIYPKASWTEQLLHWLDELFYRLGKAGSALPGGWFTVVVLLLLFAAAVIVALRVVRRTMHTNRGGAHALFAGEQLTAAEHRATAEQFAAAGDWAAAIRHRLRAIARQLEESAVLDAVPGRTATELARDAGRQLPDLANKLVDAATIFNDVTYGEQPGTEASYRMICDLDDHLRAHRHTAAVEQSAPPGGWADVR